MLSITNSLDTNTSEFHAALELRSQIARALPDLETNPDDHVHIIVGAKCHGQTVRDIDLLVIGSFSSNRSYRPLFEFSSRQGSVERPDKVLIESFCLAIEVKSHSENRVRFTGSRAEVLYERDGWKDATQQNEAQKQALINYLRALKIKPVPWITPLVWLINVWNTQLPKRPHNLIGMNTTWSMLLSVVGQVSPPRWLGNEWRLSAGPGVGNSVQQLVEALTKTITPTAIDRRRMEQINRRVADELNLHEVVGKQLLILRGRGGTGKTVRLLQLAKRLYDDSDSRVLILTYNRALVADLRRLLTILGVDDGIAGRSIQVQTVHSFFYMILQALGIISSSEDDFLRDYAKFKCDALELLEANAVEGQDIVALKKSYRTKFGWDNIFIDEAQDFPDDEREILFRLYPYNIFAVADGVDQLIRSQTPADWHADLLSSQWHIETLPTCLRMKAGLTKFVSAFAGQLGLQQSEWKPNDLVPGGQIIVVEDADFGKARGFHESCIARTTAAGNAPVDMLFCVPPIYVQPSTIDESAAQSTVAAEFRAWGWKVWDGVASGVRNTYPTETDELRIVQYDSCRGLEGWTVVLFALDEFYTYKLKQLQAVVPDASQAALQAARWVLIPLTRAMDTIVIHITGRPSPLRDALKAVAKELGELVQW